jgi:hypothetical protein
LIIKIFPVAVVGLAGAEVDVVGTVEIGSVVGAAADLRLAVPWGEPPAALLAVALNPMTPTIMGSAITNQRLHTRTPLSQSAL